MDIELTDEEIVKALELCKTDGIDNYKVCENCPCIDLHPFTCVHKLKGYAIDLINRQKAEIERLTELINEFRQEVITLNIEKLELQKQVDKAWYEVGKMCMEERKNTAKEIADWLITTESNKEDLAKIIKEHYGLEVE